MPKKKDTKKGTSVTRARERTQIKASFIIVSITALFLGTFFFGLFYLNKAAREDSSNSNTVATTNQVVEPIATSPNQLVVVHSGKIVQVNKFALSLHLVTHTKIDQTSVNTTVAVNTGELTQEVTFSRIGEVQNIGAYTLRLVSATESAAQIVIQQN